MRKACTLTALLILGPHFKAGLGHLRSDVDTSSSVCVDTKLLISPMISWSRYLQFSGYHQQEMVCPGALGIGRSLKRSKVVSSKK